MNKLDITRRIADGTGLTHDKAKKAFDIALVAMQEGINQGCLELHGLGTFRVKHKPSREAHNPKTMEPVHVPPKRRVYFRPAKVIRERLLEI